MNVIEVQVFILGGVLVGRRRGALFPGGRRNFGRRSLFLCRILVGGLRIRAAQNRPVVVIGGNLGGKLDRRGGLAPVPPAFLLFENLR